VLNYITEYRSDKRMMPGLK